MHIYNGGLNMVKVNIYRLLRKILNKMTLLNSNVVYISNIQSYTTKIYKNDTHEA